MNAALVIVLYAGVLVACGDEDPQGDPSKASRPTHACDEGAFYGNPEKEKHIEGRPVLVLKLHFDIQDKVREPSC